MNTEIQLLSQHRHRVFTWLRKNGTLNIYSGVTSRQTPSADEDNVI